MNDLAPPGWALELVRGGRETAHDAQAGSAEIRSTLAADFALVSVRLAGARRLSSAQLSAAVQRCYLRIAEILAGMPTQHPVRFWNHICHIHEPMGDGLDRYMAFNAGRFLAFSELFGGEENFGRRVATASGVGCRGEDLVIHALAGREAGVAVANPRQSQPFCYSKQFGPRPPCFARATVVRIGQRAPADRGMVLIGGTASICGEQSVHVGNLDAQIAETYANIDALLRHVGEVSQGDCTLADLIDLRIYIVDPATRQRIVDATRAAAPGVGEPELLEADLCRRELLVEIEGRARIRSLAPQRPAIGYNR